MCLLASKRPHILRVQFSGERPIGVHPLGILGIIGSAASPHWSGPLLDLNAPSWQQAGSDDLLDLAAERLGYIVPRFRRTKPFSANSRASEAPFACSSRPSRIWMGGKLVSRGGDGFRMSTVGNGPVTFVGINPNSSVSTIRSSYAESGLGAT
jgi:hypothetical protein